MRRIVWTMMTGSLLCATLTYAQQEPEGRIQQRKENQQQRIGNGVKKGSLTPHETAHLENQESKLNKETRTDRRQNGGNLTNKEKAQVNRQQNHLSKEIYQDKHSAAKQ